LKGRLSASVAAQRFLLPFWAAQTAFTAISVLLPFRLKASIPIRYIKEKDVMA